MNLKHLLSLTTLCLSTLGASAQQPTLVKDINPSTSGEPMRLCEANGNLFFIANDGNTGNELWFSDGTEAGTRLVKDINPGSSTSNIQKIISFQGKAYFKANAQGQGYELYQSDGTEAGTTFLKEFGTGSASIDPSDLFVYNNAIYFTERNDVSGLNLWKSDGTTAGTVLVKNLYTNPNASNGVYFCIVNNKLYFISSESPLMNSDIWVSDGTANGTNIATSMSGQVGALIAMNNKLFFGFGGTGAGASNKGLYSSDGTSAGTVRLKDLDLSLMINFPIYGTALAHNNVLYFIANDGVNGDELWKSDGTEAGTVLLKEVKPGAPSGFNFQSFLTAGYNNKFYFIAYDETAKRRVWMSDGTQAGTSVLDSATAGSYSPQELTAYNGYLFFRASSNTANIGEELWYTDGTREGTKLYSDVYAGFNSSSPSNFCVANNKLFFRANAGTVGAELYSLSVSPINTGINTYKNNTLMVYPNPASNNLYVQHHQHTIEKNKAYELFSIDGKKVQSGYLINNYVDVSALENGVYLLKVENAFVKVVISK